MTACYVLAMDPDCGGGMGGSGVCIATTKKVLALGIAVMPKNLGGLFAVKAQRKSVTALLRAAHAWLGRSFDRAVCEIPIDYGQKRDADPADLMRLSLIAGGAEAIMDDMADRVDMVEPYRWKGQRKKGPDGQNTLRYYGWDYDWNRKADSIPKFKIPADVHMLSDPALLRAQHYSELLDAMGLALWALGKEGADGVDA